MLSINLEGTVLSIKMLLDSSWGLCFPMESSLDMSSVDCTYSKSANC
jgi:hypothetical protein